MHRISKDRLYYSLISDLKFERRLSIGLSDEHIYKFVQRVCDKLCTDSMMVVEASIEGFGRGVHGRFGVDEPWPEWADQKDLQTEGLVAGSLCDPPASDRRDSAD
jgi:hypothetical protein